MPEDNPGDNLPAKVEPQAIEVAQQKPITADVELTATSPDEMQQSHTDLIAWCKNKVLEVKAELSEVTAAAESAKKNKWNHAALDKQVVSIGKRVTFYEKILSALEAGYCIVPNFPITLFAIRTNAKNPARLYYTQVSSWSPGNKEQKAQVLPEGEGEYKNPFPVVYQKNFGTSEKPSYQSWADHWASMEFPVSMTKAAIIDATSEAMKQKVFDEIGICPPVNKGRRQDPLIIARIIDPNPSGYGDRRVVSFMIAWHLDTRVL